MTPSTPQSEQIDVILKRLKNDVLTGVSDLAYEDGETVLDEAKAELLALMEEEKRKEYKRGLSEGYSIARLDKKPKGDRREGELLL